jgi:hypothetical protein
MALVRAVLALPKKVSPLLRSFGEVLLTIVSKVPKNTPPEAARLCEVALRTRSRPCSRPRGRPYRPSLAWMDDLDIPVFARTCGAAVRCGRCADRHRLRGAQKQSLISSFLSLGWWAGSGLVPPRLGAPSIGLRRRNSPRAARGEARDGEPPATVQGCTADGACGEGEAQGTRAKRSVRKRAISGQFLSPLSF